MSVKQMAMVWELDVAWADKLLLLALADHADHDGNRIYPSVARLAHKTGLSRRQVQYSLKALRDETKLIELVRAGGGRGNPSEYRLTLENGAQLAPLEKRVQQVHENGGERVQEAHEKGAHSAPEPSVEPSVNDSSNDESANGEQEKPASPMPMGQFGIKELAERTKAARTRGALIHSTTDRERRDFGAMFKRAAEDGIELDLMLFALDYMVAKAAGEIEGEPKAWCGYRTALDRVLEGWRPSPNGKPTLSEDELAKRRTQREELGRLMAEARAKDAEQGAR